jgi:hypothetical protein
MQKQTILSTPSIADTNVLFSKWQAIPGNGSKTLSDFYSFLTADSVDRSVFLSDYTVESYDCVEVNAVVLKVTPK